MTHVYSRDCNMLPHPAEIETTDRAIAAADAAGLRGVERTYYHFGYADALRNRPMCDRNHNEPGYAAGYNAGRAA